ncbi:MAG: Uma2 family endonuclease [Calditrichaeota bacterium]|nr:Uma2 family endonuclease [Calditrichota bacterium]
MRVKETAAKYREKKKVLTYQDYLNLPPDDFRYQLIEGELVMTPAPKVIHQIVKSNLEKHLRNFIEVKQLGIVLDAPCDVYLDDKNVVQPIFFISRKRSHIIGEDLIKGAPDLIIEVLSPHSAYYDLVEKKVLYERFGVQEYWLADPKMKWIEIYVLKDQKFHLHRRAENNQTVTSVLLKGFRLSLDQVFTRI